MPKHGEISMRIFSVTANTNVSFKSGAVNILIPLTTVSQLIRLARLLFHSGLV